MSNSSDSPSLWPFPLFTVQTDGSRGIPNPKWGSLFGTAERWDELLSSEDLEAWQRAMASAIETGRGFQLDVHLRTERLRAEQIRTDREWSRYLLSVERQESASGDGWVVSATPIGDFADQIAAEYDQDQVALRMAARQWHSFFEEAATGKAMVGLGGELLAVNPEICRLFGYRADEMLRMTAPELRHPDDDNHIDSIYEGLLRGDKPVAGIEGHYLRSDGNEMWLLLSFSLVRDSLDHPLYFNVEMQDNTARRQAESALAAKVAEVAQSNEELARSNSELERFAFVASHDLQEPLRKIRVFAGRLQNELRHAEISESSGDYLTRLSSAAERMQQLIADLLSFSRLRRPAEFRSVDLNRLAHEAAHDFETSIEECGGSIEIGDLPCIDGNATRLRQLMCNLIGNALKFRGVEAPRVEIFARSAPVSLVEKPVWELCVRDNGIGFDEKELPHLLEIFGRLHPREQYSGTGIGLAICRKVAQEHGGDITARSQVAQGSTFIVTLPQSHETPKPNSEEGLSRDD